MIQENKTADTFKGYINYYNLQSREPGIMKTYYFTGKTAEEVERLRKQFNNPERYSYIGDVVVSEPQNK